MKQLHIFFRIWLVLCLAFVIAGCDDDDIDDGYYNYEYKGDNEVIKVKQDDQQPNTIIVEEDDDDEWDDD